jgi:(p)ppGpp synthase/HD superfamily hydrolase
MESLVERAHRYAEKKHERQYRHHNREPYKIHLMGVVRLLEEIGIQDENILASGWLHDVVEDCGVFVEELKREFNPEVARIVRALTRDVNRQMYKDRIGKSDYSVKIVKLADVVQNCSDLYDDSPNGMILHKIQDCEDFYFDLAKEVCPKFHELLVEYISQARGLLRE